MKQNLREFLREYGANLPENILNGKLVRVLSDRAHTKLYFETEFDAPVPNDIIESAEQELAVRLELQSVRILCRYAPELLNTENLRNLFAVLRRDIPMINGFLEDSELVLQDQKLQITLAHGGADILEQTHFCTELARAVQSVYQTQIQVSLVGDHLHITEDEQSQMQETVIAEMPADHFSIPAEPEKTPQPQFSVIPPDDAEPVQPERPDKDSLNILFGRIIKEKPVTVATVVSQIGKADGNAKKYAVAVEVFTKPETRTLKNGKTLVPFPSPTTQAVFLSNYSLMNRSLQILI